MKKQLKTHIALILLAIVAISLMLFTQLASSSSLVTFTATSQTYSSEKDVPSQVAPELPANPLTLEISTDHFPLHAIKIEDIKVNVTQRVRPVYNLFSIALLLFGFENSLSEKEAAYFPVKALHFSAPIYILFRQIII